MDEFRARRVVDALRDRGVNAHLLRGGVDQFGIRLSLTGGRNAWAQALRRCRYEGAIKMSARRI